MYNIRKKPSNVFRLLVQFDANTKVLDPVGNKAIHLASIGRHYEISLFLAIGEK